VRPKPTEVRLVASLLHEEADDAEDLAGRIITSLDAKRERDNTQWAVVFYDPNTGTVIPFGPYPTKGAADKVLGTLTGPGPKPAQAITVKMRGAPCA